MRIQKLVLDKVACFDHIELEFPEGHRADRADIHLLVGPNGTGKTTVLSALMHANGAGDAHASLWDRMRAGGEARVTTDTGTKRTARHTHERSTFRACNQLLAYDGQRTLREAEIVSIEELPEDAKRFKPLLGAAPDPRWISSWIALNDYVRLSATSDGDLAEAEAARQRVARLAEAVSHVLGRPFRFQIQRAPFALRATLDGVPVRLDLLPDGVKAILAWLGDLLLRLEWVYPDRAVAPQLQPFVLLLDEVEVHLHPEAQRQIVPMLSELFPNAQVFIATHSPFVIASAEDAWIHQFYFDGDQVKVKPAVPSRYGDSWESVLQDIMGVTSRFAPEFEHELDAFYADVRVAHTDDSAWDRVVERGTRLRAVSMELANIVVPEMLRLGKRLDRTP
jgi:predicted ATPase